MRPRVLPRLPLGYSAFPVWGFSDDRKPISFAFHRVYRPSGRLDRDLSYWVMSWPVYTETGDQQPAGRWITYAQARRRWGRRLPFMEFASPARMRDRLPQLLAEGELALEQRPSMAPGWIPAERAT